MAAKRFRVETNTTNHETTFTRNYTRLRIALREASGYAKMYGRSRVIDTRNRSILADCKLDVRQRQAGDTRYGRKHFANCHVTGDAKKMLARNKKRKGRR